MLAATEHGGTPKLFESNLLPGRQPWFAREHVEGTAIAEELVRGPLARDEVVALMRELGDVMAHVHRRGIVHGHLTAEGVIRTPSRGFPLCIGDWSHARPHDAAPDPVVDRERTCAAPETVSDGVVDARTDMFAIGVLVYRAMTGDAFPGVHTALATLDELAARGQTLARYVARLLSPTPEQRPTAHELRDALSDLAAPPQAPEAIVRARAGFHIRRPRWTPPLPLSSPAPRLPDGTGDLVDLTAELDDDWTEA